MKHEPMTQERLDAIRELVESMWDMDPHLLAAYAREHFSVMLAEVERLRALTTMDEVMVERVARMLNEEDETPGTLSWDNESEMNRRSYRRMARAALDAAIGRWHDYPPCNAMPATEAK